MTETIPVYGTVNHLHARTNVLNAIHRERNRQMELWGEQVHSRDVWLTILVEEVGEVAQAIQQGRVASKESDANDLYKELIQVAAVATAIAEQVISDEKDI